MVSLFNLAARKALQQGISKRVSKSGLQSVEDISVFPKPQRMFPENVRPAGGEYLNPATKDILTGKNVSRGNISITPEGKPSFRVSPVEKEIVGSPDIKGATQIKTNLFKKKAGWKWKEAPKGYEDVPTLVSVENKGKHYYTLDAQFPQGVNLTRYAKSKTEPRLRPTMKGFVEVGTPVGKINVRGREHIVYDKVINREAGGKIMAGGLSNLKKSININGQPHSLAWINPDEASALKAMGGSGKKIDGIPAYFDEFTFEESADVFSDAVQSDGSIPDADTRAYDDYKSPAYQQLLANKPTVGATTYYKGKTVDDDTETDIRKGILGLYGDRMTRREALDAAKKSAFTTWRNTIGKYSADTPKDYEEWFAAQDPDALIAGFKIGDPVGQAMQSSFNFVNKQLIKRAKENLQKKAASPRGVTDKEREKHGRQSMIDAAKSGKINTLEDFTEKKDLPLAMQFSLTGQLAKIFSRTVIGTGTVGGVSVHLHEDGSITPISPEDSPGFDHEAMEGENVEPQPSPKAPPPLPPPAEPLEQKLTGMAAHYANLPKAASRQASLQSQFDILAATYGREQAAALLNQPLNIFAEVG